MVGIAAETSYFLKNPHAWYDATQHFIRFTANRKRRKNESELTGYYAAALLLILIAAAWIGQKHKQGESAIEKEEMAGPNSPAELQTLIKKLSSSNAEERSGAEHELAQAGVFADPVLKAAEPQAEGEAKAAIQRLRNRTRFAALKDLDYSTALPAETFFCLQLSNIQETLEKSRATAIGKLLLRPAFDKAREEIWEKIRSGYAHETLLPPLEYLKGQLAFGLFQKTPGQFEKVGKGGLLFELKGADPQGGYLEWTDTLQKSGGKVS